MILGRVGAVEAPGHLRREPFDTPPRLSSPLVMLPPRLRHHGLQATTGDHRFVAALKFAHAAAAFAAVAQVTDFLCQGRRHRALFPRPGPHQPGLVLTRSSTPSPEPLERHPDRLAERFPAQVMLLSQGGGAVHEFVHEFALFF